MSDFHKVTIGSLDNFLIWRQGSGHTVEIYDLNVRAEDRRKGYGRRLINVLLLNLPKGTLTLYAITRASNMIAQQFYEELRFRPIPLREFYKDEPLENGLKYTDAIMYVKDIGSHA